MGPFTPGALVSLGGAFAERRGAGTRTAPSERRYVSNLPRAEEAASTRFMFRGIPPKSQCGIVLILFGTVAL